MHGFDQQREACRARAHVANRDHQHQQGAEQRRPAQAIVAVETLRPGPMTMNAISSV